ncbi:ROK family protein [Roseivirga sp. BDSF3-8]|uniref:ROK family protein n=1 Tax=Roseivirga sp. BDSF3-8 TaxID=3241598 RepID=UPI00353213AB
MKKFLGIDIGGTNVKMAAVNRDGKIIDRRKFPTSELSSKGFVPSFLDVVDRYLSDHTDIKKIGVGVPGMLSKNRKTTLEVPAIPQLNGVDLHSSLTRRFQNKKFYLENDANSAALGEYHFAEQENMPETFLFITLGTGVGGAAIINKTIFRGGDGNGMELGHTLSKNGKRLEQNIGKAGIMGIAEEKLRNYTGDTEIKCLENMSPKELSTFAAEGDPFAADLFSDVGLFLGESLVSTIRVLDIKTILIGGGVSAVFDHIKDAMLGPMKEYLTPYYMEKVDIHRAVLGNRAGIVGAASLCFMD